MRHVLIALALASAVARSGYSQEIGYVDFLNLTIRESTRHPRVMSGGCGSFVHTGQEQATKVTLLSLDKTIYQVGDDVTFEVRVENSGSKSIVIPWSPHRGDLEPQDLQSPYKYLVGVVIVEFEDPKGRWFTVSESLYGTSDAPGTLLELRPGQWFTIRGRDQIRASPDWGKEQFRESTGVDAKVRAGFREDLGTYSPDSGGSDSQWCALVGPNAANELQARVVPR